jgi:hypothetical protein
VPEERPSVPISIIQAAATPRCFGGSPAAISPNAEPAPAKNRSSQPGGSRGAGGQALRIRHINCMEVRKKRPRGFKKRPRGFK